MTVFTKISDTAVGSYIAAEIGNSFDYRYGKAGPNVAVVVGSYQMFPGREKPENEMIVVAFKTPEGDIRISSAGRRYEAWYDDENEVPAYVTDDLPLESPAAASRYLSAIGQTVESVKAMADSLPNGEWECNPRSTIGRR